MDYIVGFRALSLDSVTYSSLHLTIFLVAILVFLFVGLTTSLGIANTKNFSDSALVSYAKFFYASFLKPHRRGDGGQQSALESFYEAQVCALNFSRHKTITELWAGRSIRCHTQTTAPRKGGYARTIGSTTPTSQIQDDHY